MHFSLLLRISVLLIAFTHFPHPSTQLSLGNHQFVLYDSVSCETLPSLTYSPHVIFWNPLLPQGGLSPMFMQWNLSFEFSLWDSGKFNSSWWHRIYVLILSFSQTDAFKRHHYLGCLTFHVIFVGGTIINVGLISYSELQSLQSKPLIVTAVFGFPWVTLCLSYNDFVLKLWIFKKFRCFVFFEIETKKSSWLFP